MTTPPNRALVRFGLNSANARRLAKFYETAVSAQVDGRERQEADCFTDWPSSFQGGAERTLLRMGESSVEILEFDHPGTAYPGTLSPYDPRFQHLAIVVTDMRVAMDRLSSAHEWTAISSAGPQTLPASTGGVTAFKFRDPEGHPLEFLQFREDTAPAHWRRATTNGVFLGIDHSAISIGQIDRSLRFYEALGLRIASRTLNRGIEQERLDGVSDPQVDVIGMAPATPTPHLELLHYRTQSRPSVDNLLCNDIAATRLTWALPGECGARGRLVQDPDGHFLELPR